MVQALKNLDRQSSLPYKNLDDPTKPKPDSKKKWVALTFLIAIYGFLKNISPECPYIAEFLSGPRFNFTQTQVTQDIYPMSTYGSVIQMFIVLLVTDIVRYKPVIVVGAVGFILHKALLVWGHTFLEMQLNQFFWGTSKACSLAYKTYIYSMVSREHFQMVTAVIRIAPKAGTLASSIFSQVALSVFFLTIEELNFISMWASVLALVCALMLPSLKHSLFFHPQSGGESQAAGEQKGGTRATISWSHVLNLLWQDLKDAYTNPILVKWCIWWILATAFFQLNTKKYIVLEVFSSITAFLNQDGLNYSQDRKAFLVEKGSCAAENFQDCAFLCSVAYFYFKVTDYYVQVLWTTIAEGNKNQYNAGVEAMYTIISGLVCYLVGKGLAVDWHRWGQLVLGLITVAEGALLFWIASTLSVYYAYAIYITFGTLYDVLMVISNSEVAKHLKNDSFALIFGINSFLALIFQSLLTYVFTSKNALSLSIRHQFLSIGTGFLCLGICFILKAIHNCCKSTCRNKQTEVDCKPAPGTKTLDDENNDRSIRYS